MKHSEEEAGQILKRPMTIPQELREALDLALSAAEVTEPGDYVALRPLMGGILISKAMVTPQVRAEDVLRHRRQPGPGGGAARYP